MSNFCPEPSGRRWFLVWVHLFSRAVWREGPCRQISPACVGNTRRVPATLGLPPLMGVCFPVYTAQAPGCSIWSGPCIACGSSFLVFHKSADSVGPAFCAFPGPSSSGSQELEERTLPGCSAPYPLCGLSLSLPACRLGAPCVCSGELVSSRGPPSRCRPSRISGSLWLQTGGLLHFDRGCCL